MPGDVRKLNESAKELRPGAKAAVTDSVMTVDNADVISGKGKKAGLLNDRPLLMHCKASRHQHFVRCAGECGEAEEDCEGAEPWS